MLFEQGRLEKMTIQAFKETPNCDDKPELSTDDADTYVVQVNPTSYSLDNHIRYTEQQVPGTSGDDARYSHTPPRTVNFTFLFDATGVVPASQLASIPVVGAVASTVSSLSGDAYAVADEIAKFSAVVYDYKGEMHRPRKVRLSWGALQFDGALTSLSYEFKLFAPDGTPLRATATCAFQEAMTDVERQQAENNESPDVTHLRETREGDQLHLMAHEVYGEARHYLAVARHNKLIDFRRLRAGARLELPRLEGRGSTRGRSA